MGKDRENLEKANESGGGFMEDDEEVLSEEEEKELKEKLKYYGYI
jgi:hypothetical protein